MVSLPFAAQALVFPFNIPGVTTSIVLTLPILAGIFTGNITKWNDIAITSLNIGVTFPNQNITVIVRNDSTYVNTLLYDGLLSQPAWGAARILLTSATLSWPTLSNLHSSPNLLSHGNALSNIPYSFGYMLQDEVCLLLTDISSLNLNNLGCDN
jgi:phosphate transport system substrate-binding protein